MFLNKVELTSTPILHTLDNTPLYCQASQSISNDKFDHVNWVSKATGQILEFSLSNTETNDANGQTLSTQFIRDKKLLASEKTFFCCTYKNNAKVSCKTAIILDKEELKKNNSAQIATSFNSFVAILLSNFIFYVIS